MFPSYTERSINSITFHPASDYPHGLGFIEIQPNENDPTASPSINEGHLNEVTIKSWIDGASKPSGSIQPRGSLRLILAGRTSHSNLFDHFPFSEETFRTVVAGFELPEVYPATLSAYLPHYAYLASTNRLGDKILSVISRTFSFREAGHALALTYNVRTKNTSAIIQGPSNSQYLSKLCSYLKERADLAAHPAFLVLVAAQLEYEATDQGYLPLRADMIHIEKWTGHGSLINRSNRENFDLFTHLPAVTRELNLFSSKVIGETERVKSCLLRHERILELIDHVNRYSTNPETAQSAELRHNAEFLATGWKSLLYRYEAFEKNVQVQLAVLYNTAVQRDSKLNLNVAKSSASIAAASKRDSSVMKSISLLTMLFLPATFVSILFAIPLFNWSADNISAVATPHAWIYLAVALPLTIATVAIWFAWLRFNQTMRSREAQNTESKGIDDGEKNVPFMGSSAAAAAL
jgi:hypothetical protein